VSWRWRPADFGEPEMVSGEETVARAHQRCGDSTGVVGGGWGSPRVAIYDSGTQAEKSHRRQAAGGVEAGVNVDIEVHGTLVELVAVPAGPESGWRRPAPAMRPQGRKKMALGNARSALSGDLDAEEAARRRAMR
jgi:hypothetical protein